MENNKNENPSCPAPNQECLKTSIGGQAVLEGIMMRGPEKTCLAVRMPDGSIKTEVNATPNMKVWYKKTPFIRGIFNFFDSMSQGYKYLMRSAELTGELEEEETAFEKKLKAKLGDKYETVFESTILVLALILCVGLFMFLPTFLVKQIQPYIGSAVVMTAIESFVKLGIFFLYLLAVSQMKDIRRTFMFHGAEHKCIFCYEHGEELTVENVRKYSRFHPRCGTSFLVITLLISIFVFAFVGWGNVWQRVLLKLICLPITMSLAYECIKFAGRHDNTFTRILSAPGLWTQRLTTKEPDDEMIEVAIAAMKEVIPENAKDALY